MKKIIGRFYFKLNENQNLSGMFSNNLHKSNYAEQALRISGSGFVGEYKSSWTDNLGTWEANLEISIKKDCVDIYSLHWLNENSSIQFYGEGFIVDNILIGDYRNYEKI